MRIYRDNWTMAIVLLVLALLLVACSQEEPTPTPEPEAPTPVEQEEATAVPEEAEPVEQEPVEEAPEVSQPIYNWGEVADRLWVLVGYGDAANPTVVEEGTLITAIFSSVEPTVSGSGGCNNYFTGYESTNEGDLTISGPIGSTMMACEGTMETEAAYFAALETVTGWSLTEEGRLELVYSTGQTYEEKLVFAQGEVPLTGPTWRLVSLGDPDSPSPVETGTSITAEFTPETDTTGIVGGSSTCNSYSTSYTLDGSSISFGPTAGTMMMCPIGADQETAYLAALGSAQTYEIAGSNLFITYDGGVLSFTSQDLPLENVLWQAVMVAGEPVPGDVEITALFEPGETAGAGTIGGSSGCNSFNTGYETSEDLGTNPTTHFLTISSPMAMTMALCPDEALGQLEQSTLALLETAETYEIFGDQLVISSPNGDIQYAANREPLEGTLWQLISQGEASNPQPPVEGSNFTAQFNRLPTLPSGTVVGETGCNNYNATFTANVNEIKINLPAKTNNEDCPWGVGNIEVEQQFFLALNSATQYRILGNVLQIPYGEDQILNFQATQPEGGEGVDLTILDDTFWYLLSIGDNALLPFTEITAGFEIDEGGLTGTVSGSGGCNAYNAAIGENFTIAPIASTQKACPEAVLDQEGGYFDWLGKAYAYDRAGDQLLISTANGVLTYNSSPVLDQSQELQSGTWYLVSVGNLTAVPGSGASTTFAPDGSSLSGSTGCNDFNGSYTAEPGNLISISGFSATQAACTTEDLAKQEEALLIFLQSATGYTVIGNQLQIQTVDGSVINYTSIPPAEVGVPTAVINGPEAADTGELLTFDGSGSLPMGSPIVNYSWNMGDGTTLSGAAVQYSYDTANAYDIELTVTSQAGATNTAVQSVLVRPVVEVSPPTAVIEGPSMASVGEPVTFNAANSESMDSINSFQWQSGDGNNTNPSPDSSFTTIYAQPGVYYPSVTVTDGSGLSDSASIEIVINAQLEGTDWYLTNSIPGTSVSLVFANGNVSGFAGCNSYNATYMTTLAAGPTNNISIGPVSASQSLCGEPIMNQEQAYLSDLATASSYTISGSSLTLTTVNGPLTFSAARIAPAVNQ